MSERQRSPGEVDTRSQQVLMNNPGLDRIIHENRSENGQGRFWQGAVLGLAADGCVHPLRTRPDAATQFRGDHCTFAAGSHE